MRRHRMALGLFAPIICLLGSGCLSFHRDRPIAVLVRDAETKQPIPTAEVHLTYPLAKGDESDGPRGKTDPQGVAHLRTAPNGRDAVMVEANAPNYLRGTLMVSDAELQKIEPEAMFEKSSKRPVNFTLELFAGPAFGIDLILPTGYRGVVKVATQLNDTFPAVKGQRQFSFTVGSDGGVLISGPTLLGNVAPAAYTAHYTDGTAIGTHMDNTQVGFRWLKHEDNHEIYVLGTEPEYQNFRRQLFPEDSSGDRPRHDGGPQGGGGRGGRGGRGGGGMGGGGGRGGNFSSNGVGGGGYNQ